MINLIVGFASCGMGFFFKLDQIKLLITLNMKIVIEYYKKKPFREYLFLYFTIIRSSLHIL